MMILKWDEFDYKLLKHIGKAKRFAGNPASRTQVTYKNIICAFDIETTVLPDVEIDGEKQSIMYVWQFAMGPLMCIMGRTWEEFKSFMAAVQEQLKKDERLLVFVHNLSYEFQFLKGVIPFESKDVFCLDKRKIRKASSGPFEFRCSYIHSAQSLDRYLKDMGVKDLKLSGEEFDYSKIRYPDTPLTDKEIEYCVHDVIGLVEAIEIDMKIEKDSFYSFPLTSTGYVRRDAKRAMREIPHTFIQEQQPDMETYLMLHEAMRGGNTHGNPYLADFAIWDVTCVDRSSSYPDVIINNPFPVTPFKKIARPSEQMLELLLKRGKAVLMELTLNDVRIREGAEYCPYLAYGKCFDAIHCTIDNGRIKSADMVTFTCTDIDYDIIVDQYEWSSMTVNKLMHADYGQLPDPVKALVIEYYRRKTILKGNPAEALNYIRSKAKLNSIYGFFRQDPVKQLIIFNGIDYEEQTAPVEELLEKHNKHNTYSLYQWGVWTTAWARKRLQEAIDTTGDDFVYCDTDSVFYKNNHDWSSYNELRRADSIKNKAYREDSKGRPHYMGVLELDKHCQRFKTLGAKKYAYEDDDGDLHITISGVSKKFGAQELKSKGGLEAFRDGFTFTDSGKVSAIYNDMTEPVMVRSGGREIPVTSNVVLTDTTYTVSITDEYKELLNNLVAVQEIIKYTKERNYEV